MLQKFLRKYTPKNNVLYAARNQPSATLRIGLATFGQMCEIETGYLHRWWWRLGLPIPRPEAGSVPTAPATTEALLPAPSGCFLGLESEMVTNALGQEQANFVFGTSLQVSVDIPRHRKKGVQHAGVEVGAVIPPQDRYRFFKT